MQTNIQIKDKELSEKIRKFNKENYPHLSPVKLFVHALVELMKREK